MNRRHFVIGSLGLFSLAATACSQSGNAAMGAASSPTKRPPLPNLSPNEERPESRVGEEAAPMDTEANAPATRPPDRLQLPSIEVDIPVVELGWHPATNREGQIFSEWDVAEHAAGWHKNSALPGSTGNVVMSGHNNILGAVFRELDQIRQGEEAIVWVGDARYTYTVTRVLIVPEENASYEQRVANAGWIDEFDDSRLTLVSCWPRNNNSHRIIVIAKLDAEGQA